MRTTILILTTLFSLISLKAQADVQIIVSCQGFCSANINIIDAATGKNIAGNLSLLANKLGSFPVNITKSVSDSFYLEAVGNNGSTTYSVCYPSTQTSVALGYPGDFSNTKPSQNCGS